MESNEFVDVMRGRETEDLLDVLNVQRKSYVPKAIEAVEIVLSERGVTYVKLTDEEMEREDDAKTTIAEAAYITSDWTRLGEYLIDYIITILVSFCCIPYINSTLAYIVTFFLYYFIMESTTGKTVGKMLFKLKVVNIDGSQPDGQAIAIRTLCRFIPFDGLSFICGGWENHELKSNWHDRFSNTYVISEKKYNNINDY